MIVTHFFVANASQSDIYRGSFETAQSILQAYSNDVSGAAVELANALNRLLRKYYDDSSVSVVSRMRDEATSNSVVEFVISGAVLDGSASYQLNKVAEAKNGTFLRFIEINNG